VHGWSLRIRRKSETQYSEKRRKPLIYSIASGWRVGGTLQCTACGRPLSVSCDILPGEIRRQLLDSIDRTILDNPPNGGSRQATDEEKEKYLFERRNDYTHRANFRPPAGEWLAGGVTNIVQEHHADFWISTQTHGWLPGILEKTVQVGLACYTRARSK